MTRHERQNQSSGQAIVEYMLMLLLALGIITTISVLFRRSVQFLWQAMSCEVTAACPACPPPDEVRNKLFPGACK